MSVKVRPYRGKAEVFEVDIRFEWPEGGEYRERVKAPVSTMSAARRWGEQREREVFARGKRALEDKEVEKKEAKKIPTVEQFIPRFIEEHCRADRLKPSSIASNEQVLARYIVPSVGKKKLHDVTNVDVQRIKAEMAHLSPKTVNNALCQLSMLLKKAVEWGVLEIMPCTVKLLKVTHDERATTTSTTTSASSRPQPRSIPASTSPSCWRATRGSAWARSSLWSGAASTSPAVSSWWRRASGAAR